MSQELPPETQRVHNLYASFTTYTMYLFMKDHAAAMENQRNQARLELQHHLDLDTCRARTMNIVNVVLLILICVTLGFIVKTS